MTLRSDLMAAIASWEQDTNGPVSDATPLISSSRLDSLNLVRLMTWIESKVGHEVDVTAIDMTVEWDTVDAIVAFVERERSSGRSR